MTYRRLSPSTRATRVRQSRNALVDLVASLHDSRIDQVVANDGPTSLAIEAALAEAARQCRFVMTAVFRVPGERRPDECDICGDPVHKGSLCTVDYSAFTNYGCPDDRQHFIRFRRGKCDCPPPPSDNHRARLGPYRDAGKTPSKVAA